MQHLRAVLEQLGGCRVLIVGDVMLDEYVRGEVSRISPEAPVPVLEVREVRSSDVRLGGAANAAANIQALGGKASLVGVVGTDDSADAMRKHLEEHGIARLLVPDPSRPTSKKTRLVAQQQQIVRVDYEKRTPVSGAVAEKIKREILGSLPDVHAVVLSDYAKGVVTPEIAQFAIAAARKANLPVIVDPKQRDFAVYRGATVLTPNLHELEVAAPSGGPFDLERSVAKLLPTLEGAALLVTRSADGMTLYRADRPSHHVPAVAKEVFDVTGAGDTVVAMIALALAARVSFEHALELASIAAAISVSKRGTSTVTPAELLAALDAG
ncbi:MAG: bifunctional heptose 7-phosphate kinase/heptose 1-phosphate adenyltransferase [Myxococcales bacterium]|nr:bifunctional heptose 7-phosphate kinase/heptose 1-phosphate adenyltransferase [Myxococcales bacterium]